MNDVAVSLAVFLAICIGLALALLLLSNWHRWIEKRLRGITRDDLEREAAATEAGYYDRSPHVRRLSAHVKRRNQGRRYDAA